MNPIWIICPVLDCIDYTRNAIKDFLAQSEPTRVLIINQGSTDETRQALEQMQEDSDNRVLIWTHQPPLKSLATSWNRALDFVWELGGTEAMVVNNDVRLHEQTVGILQGVLGSAKALFVTAVGVTEAQFKEESTWFDDTLSRGGPDFSCFLISKACHEKYRFDENFVPAYREDLDMHRRMMLGGDGDKIFSVNLPFLHYASRTINRSPDAFRAFNERAHLSVEYYRRKWGGDVNQETFYAPFDTDAKPPDFLKGVGPTTPELQNWIQGSSVLAAQTVAEEPAAPQ